MEPAVNQYYCRRGDCSVPIVKADKVITLVDPEEEFTLVVVTKFEDCENVCLTPKNLVKCANCDTVIGFCGKKKLILNDIELEFVFGEPI